MYRCRVFVGGDRRIDTFMKSPVKQTDKELFRYMDWSISYINSTVELQNKLLGKQMILGTLIGMKKVMNELKIRFND